MTTSCSKVKAFRLAGELVLSSILALLVVIVSLAGPARAHEVTPPIADVEIGQDRITMNIRLAAEALLAGVDLSEVADTNDDPAAGAYDRFRALTPDALEAEITRDWAALAPLFVAETGGAQLPFTLDMAAVEPEADADIARSTRLELSAPLPPGDSPVTFSFARDLGGVILRQTLPEGATGEAYSALLSPAQATPPLPRTGGIVIGWWENAVNYTIIGFEHILPLGWDHVLFVLGIFFFSLRGRALVAQITTFTLAHTLTLALATLGVISAPSSIVEPLIALSIAVVAIENFFARRVTATRIAVIFGFGLLHGLGFASMLGDIGLSQGRFLSSLIAFNVGVELGQLTVILLAYLLVGLWFGKKPYYRRLIALPASSAVAVFGVWWFIERTLLA